MKKGAKIALSIVAGVLIIGGIGVYIAYDKISNYFLEEAIAKQMTQELIEQTGVDLSEAGRSLTAEETELFKSVLNTKQEIAEQEEVEPAQQEEVGTAQPVEDLDKATQSQKAPTTDDLKTAIKQQAQAVASAVPAKDKNAMLNLVLSNLTSSDMNYLMSLVLDGVSSSDLSEAKRIARERFSAQELEQVEGYYNAYKHLIP